MTSTYKDALQEVLAAVHAGEDAGAALRRFPEHAPALAEDLRLVRGLGDTATRLPAPPQAARQEAARRLSAELASARQPGIPATARTQVKTWAPRYALALTAVFVAGVIGALLVLGGGGAPVEAATIEGVVVENAGGSLTVQTLDALEQIAVPPDAPVSDTGGAPLTIESITAGQVVIVEIERRERNAVALRVRRDVDSVLAWCTGAAERCRALSDRIERTLAECDRAAQDCPVAAERLEQLRETVDTAARLEALKQACRTGRAEACRELAAFCREQGAVCGDLLPQLQPDGGQPDAADRLSGLEQRCADGDETACRRLGEFCIEDPTLCPTEMPAQPADRLAPEATLPPAPTLPVLDTATPLPAAPTLRPVDAQSTATVVATIADLAPADRAPPATPTPVRDIQAEATATPTEPVATPSVEPFGAPADSPPADRRPGSP